MFVWVLALRNLVRNPRRSVLSMGAIVAGVAVLILGQGLIGGLEENIIRAQVDTLSAHVLVRPKEYPTQGLSHPIDRLVHVEPGLSAFFDQNARAWTTRVLFTPRVVHGADALRVRAIAFDPLRDPAVFPRDVWRVEGKVPETAADGILVSRGVARILGLSPGEPVVIEARTSAGAINALSVPVSGVFTAGASVLDLLSIFVPMDFGEDLLRTEGARSHVAIRLDRRERAESFAADLRARSPADSEVVTWVDETRDMLEVQEIRRRALDLLVLVLMGMSATGIANTILMAAYERIREIGTLRAMGMTRPGVIRLFITEGAYLGVIGGVVGALLGGGTVAYYAQRGIDLSRVFEEVGNLPVATMLYLEFSQTVILLAVAFGVGVAILASVWPSFVASSMQPADAVRAD